MTAMQSRLRPALGLAAIVVVLISLPYWLSPVYLTAATATLVLGLFAMSLNLLLGGGGMPSAGHALFFGLGAYGAGLFAVHVSSNALLMIAAAIGIALAGALVTGWIVARSSAAYLLMITIAFGELFAAGVIQWRSLTGGKDGLPGVPAASVLPDSTPLIDVAPVYWFVLAAFAVGAAGLVAVTRSPFGRALRGMRDNELRMRALGYETTLYRWAAICIAAAFAGMAGALSVVSLQFAAPSDMQFLHSAVALIAVIVGGTGRWWGPVLGAAVITYAGVMLPSSLGAYQNLVVGLIFIAVVYAMPGGIAGLWERIVTKARRG